VYRSLRSNDEWTAALPIVWESRDHMAMTGFATLLVLGTFKRFMAPWLTLAKSMGWCQGILQAVLSHGRSSMGDFFCHNHLFCLHTLFAMILRRKMTCTHDGSMVLLYMVLHGSHQYTPFMLAYMPAPWIRHGYM